MTNAVQVLLAVACVAALVGQGFGQSYCDSATVGSQIGAPIKLPDVDISSGIRDWKIEIPRVPGCETPTGVQAVTCDTDVIPTSKFLNKNLVYVHRNGMLGGVGAVHVTVYC